MNGLRAIYFSYFAFIGGFTPFLSLWLADAGWSIATVGVLVSINSMMRIVGPGFWGYWARRLGAQVVLIRGGVVVALVCILVLPWVSQQLVLLALVFVVLYFVTAAVMPLTESLALSATQGESGSYGRLRLWGSVGFLAAVLGVGPLLDVWGIRALPWLAAGLALSIVVSAWWLREAPLPPALITAVSLRERLKEPAIRGFFISAGLMIFAHAGFYTFFSLYLEGHGYSKSMIGMIWALGVVVEVALFRWQKPLFDRFAARSLLLFSILVAVLRFFAIGISEGALWIILLTQLTHAITFGVHHSATMHFLHQWFDARQQPAAQGLFVTVTYGIGGTMGGLGAGWLWSNVSAQAMFFTAAAVAGLSAWVLARALRVQ